MSHLALTDERQRCIDGGPSKLYVSCTMTHDLDETLRWYWENRFTAEDVTRATGLTERAQRELLKVGVIQTIPQAKTKARLLNARMIKRSAIISALNSCGFSLAVAGQIVYAAPMIEDFLFDCIDPSFVLLEHGGPSDPVTNMPLNRRDDPRPAFRIFDKNARPVADPDDDWSIDIINGRYVVVGGKPNSLPYGELSPDRTTFFWWENAVPSRVGVGPDGEGPSEKQFEYDRSMSDEAMAFTFKKDTEEDEAKAQFATNNPVTKISVNVSLALTIALRRLVYIDPPEDH